MRLLHLLKGNRRGGISILSLNGLICVQRNAFVQIDYHLGKQLSNREASDGDRVHARQYLHGG